MADLTGGRGKQRLPQKKFWPLKNFSKLKISLKNKLLKKKKKSTSV